MNLIGQYDSPFVRRVALALRFYGIPFEHTPWSTFGDAEKIALYNPLMRVPTLVLDDGEVLIESTAILDYLDEISGPSRALIPDCGHVRREVLHICALATGLGDKAVSLFFASVSCAARNRNAGSSAAARRSPVYSPASRRIARGTRRGTGSVTALPTPTLRWPASSVSPGKPMPGYSMRRAIRRSIVMRRRAKRCSRFRISCSPWRRRTDAPMRWPD